MRIFKIVKIIVLIVIGLTTCLFALRPLIRREVIKNQWINVPSVIPTQNWKYFASKEGQFSTLFPGVPESTNVSVRISGESMEMHLFYVEADIDDWFGAGFVDSPKFENKAIVQNPQKLLGQAQAIAISNQMGRVVFQKEMKSDGYPGREFEYAAGGRANYSAHFKLILVGSRVYEIYVVFLTANPHKEDQDIFINSFHLHAH